MNGLKEFQTKKALFPPKTSTLCCCQPKLRHDHTMKYGIKTLNNDDELLDTVIFNLSSGKVIQLNKKKKQIPLHQSTYTKKMLLGRNTKI